MTAAWLALAYCAGMLTAHLIHWREWRRLRRDLERLRLAALARGLASAAAEFQSRAREGEPAPFTGKTPDSRS